MDDRDLCAFTKLWEIHKSLATIKELKVLDEIIELYANILSLPNQLREILKISLVLRITVLISYTNTNPWPEY